VSTAIPLLGVTAMAWPPIPGAAACAMLALQWQLERSQWLDRQTLQRAQLLQLRVLAAHAAQHVPWYRSAARRGGIEDFAGLTLERFRDWPVLRATDARAHASELCASIYPKEHGQLLESRTTGSTGRPFRVFQTEVSQFFTHALVIRDHLVHQRDFSAKLGKTIGIVQSGRQSSWGLASGVFPTGPAVTIGTAPGIDAQLDWLIDEAPAYVIAHAGNLRALLLRSRETGRVPTGVRQLIAQGGLLPPDLRELAASLWNAEVADTYSCEEFGLLAFQCPGHPHYHVNAEHVLVELLRDDGTPCAPGETGRVIVTALNNFAMPLVRYEQGDYAVAGGACPAGRGLPTLERIAGRSRNMLRTPDGRQVFPAISADMCLDIAPIRQFRLVQTALDAIELHYAMDRELGAFERSALAAALRERFGYPFRFGFVRVDRFEEGVGGKFEDFVSRLGAGA
jgi:phenylacetate-CoA ligase